MIIADRPERSRSPVLLGLLGGLALLLLAGLVALGNWQVERRAWKLELIDRVESRVHAAPVRAPGPGEWPEITAATAEYRRIAATGRFLPGQDTSVAATTDRGAGFWIMSPFRTADGFTLLVNRGFAGGQRGDATGTAQPAPEGEVRISGLLRMDEPGGGFLRANDPAAGRWYSRDIGAMAAARGLSGPVAPYFMDLGLEAGLPAPPVAGMTVIQFRNTHLVYALTWYGLALMVAGGIAIVARHEWRLRRTRRRGEAPR
ncbi:SURF1 family protein [Pseudoroseomonas globiformis]|uniref:SURF1-like protein n=1 Tax=Teichococcus globiformis TaxID=2307229 RepID=A0ABV7FZN2_9PROT